MALHDKKRAEGELDPNLAEAYTTLAEITWTVSPTGLEEAVALANTAIKINPESWGAHHLLAWLYTIKSGLKASLTLI